MKQAVNHICKYWLGIESRNYAANIQNKESKQEMDKHKLGGEIWERLSDFKKVAFLTSGGILQGNPGMKIQVQREHGSGRKRPRGFKVEGEGFF